MFLCPATENHGFYKTYYINKTKASLWLLQCGNVVWGGDRKSRKRQNNIRTTDRDMLWIWYVHETAPGRFQRFSIQNLFSCGQPFEIEVRCFKLHKVSASKSTLISSDKSTLKTVPTCSVIFTGRKFRLLPGYEAVYIYTHARCYAVSCRQTNELQAVEFLLTPSDSSTIQESPRILLKPKFHYRVHNSPPFVRVLSQIDSVHAHSHYFFNTHFKINLHRGLGLASGFSL